MRVPKLSSTVRVLIVVLVIAACLGVVGNRLKDEFVRRMIVKVLKAAGGFDVSIGALHFGLLSPTLEVKDVRILNPTNCPVRDAMEIRRIFMRYDRLSFLHPEGHVPEIDVDLAKIVLIHQSDGHFNLEKLANIEKDIGSSGPSAKIAPAAKPEAPGEAARTSSTSPRGKAPQLKFDLPQVKIDRLHIKIGSLDYYDYGMGGNEPLVMPMTVNLDQTFEDVTNITDIADQLEAKLLVGNLFGDLGLGKAKQPEEKRKQTERDVDDQIERVVNHL